MKDIEKSKEQLITERKQSEGALRKSEKWLTRIKECFLNFGTDPIENINLLTMLCGELMGATCAFYNRLDRGLLCSWGQWNPPPDYKPVYRLEGHICYDVIKTAGDEIFVITDCAPDSVTSLQKNRQKPWESKNSS
jgi:hypothetical protein